MKKDASASRRSHALALRQPIAKGSSNKRADKTVRPVSPSKRTTIELCAGAGGQALGVARAGFDHLALVEFDAACCWTLRSNRPLWNVFHCDITKFSGSPYRNKVDLLRRDCPACRSRSRASRKAN